ncbi:TRAP transporter small permease [Pararhodobacter oceanensis]|uniref:TRAP transporter small permease n=1 Tax=Pararhodobacter oceanensis TaxID=2172121 RepID=UPI003A936B13
MRGPQDSDGIMRGINMLSRVFSVIAKALNATGTLVVLALVVMINSDVVSRNLFNAPFPGTYEMVQFLMVMIVFLQLPDVIRINRLTRSDGALAVLAMDRPRAARVIARIIDTVSCIFMGLIAFAIWPELQRSWGSGAFFGTPGIFTAPYWPIHLAILVSSTLSSAIFATKAITGKRRPEHLHLEESGA